MKLINNNAESKEFMGKYNIDKEQFENADLNWDELNNIYENYKELRSDLEPISSMIAELLRKPVEVHSVRSRIKDPEHLIEKIVRKTIEKRKEEVDYKIHIGNYREEITDLIGLRVLHIYKDDAYAIDKYIRETWALKERAKIYFRDGDFPKGKPIVAEELDIDPHQHPAGYRSWHYLVEAAPTKDIHVAEIQVRTIFEEGWSEIDHKLRYPYDINNPILLEQLSLLNRLAGSADEMTSSILSFQRQLKALKGENEKKDALIGELKYELEQVKIEKVEKERLQEKLSKVQEVIKSIQAQESMGLATIAKVNKDYRKKESLTTKNQEKNKTIPIF